MTNFDLKTLGLADGTHEITVVAKASGYKDSPPSNAVNYVVGSGGTTYTITAGTYKFKDTVGGKELSESFNFTSNGSSFTSILVELSPSLGICVGYGNSRVYASGSNGWSYNNSNYQTITTTTEQAVSKEFYDWFVENTYTLAGVYVFNKTISGMTGATGYPNYQFTVNYATEYYNGDTFIQGNGTNITLLQSGVFFFTSYLDDYGEIQNRYSDGTTEGHIGWYSFNTEFGDVFQPEIDTDRIRTYDFGTIPQPVPENFYNWVHANAVKQN